MRLSIRSFRDADEDDVVGVWHRSGQAAYTYLPTWQAFTWGEAARVFRDVIRTRCELWVGTVDERVVAYLAMKASYIDRLYVDPVQWRRGWGERLVVFAKGLCPTGLTLHTHQEDHAARQLYEKHGFKIVRFGVSAPPESAPDVQYRWTPD